MNGSCQERTGDGKRLIFLLNRSSRSTQTLSTLTHAIDTLLQFTQIPRTLNGHPRRRLSRYRKSQRSSCTKKQHRRRYQETLGLSVWSVCSLKPLLPPQRILLFLGANSERYMTSRLSMESSGDKQSGRHRLVVVTWCNNNTDRATSSDHLPS